MRVYLASTLPELAAALQAGQIGPAPLAGFAVTPALREWYASGDLDELEYAAMALAARASLRMLAGDTAAPPRRVTLASAGWHVVRIWEHESLEQALAAVIAVVGARVPLTPDDDPVAADGLRASRSADKI